jgi:hypothetical protein
MMYMPSSIKIAARVQIILRFCLRNLGGCKGGITNDMDL